MATPISWQGLMELPRVVDDPYLQAALKLNKSVIDDHAADLKQHPEWVNNSNYNIEGFLDYTLNAPQYVKYAYLQKTSPVSSWSDEDDAKLRTAEFREFKEKFDPETATLTAPVSQALADRMEEFGSYAANIDDITIELDTPDVDTIPEVDTTPITDGTGAIDTTTPTLEEPGTNVVPGSDALEGDVVGGTEIPIDITQSDDYLALDEDMQAILDLFWQTFTTQSAENQELAFEALGQASELLQPWAAATVAFATDAVRDQFAYIQASTSARVASAMAAASANGTLAKNARLEEKQIIAALGRELDKKIIDLGSQMADTGMSYSTQRADLEEYIALQNQDMVASTQRNTENTLAKLAASSAAAAAAASAASASGEYQMQQLARQAEMQLGTEAYNQLGLGIPSIGGSNGVPIYPGTIELQRQNTILQLAGEIKDYGAPQSLNLLFEQYM